MRRAYIDGPEGQLHLTHWPASKTPSDNPVLCLPPSPYSGVAWYSAAALLAQTRNVWALDYPGFGNSERSATPPSIAQYADCAAAAIRSIRGSDSSSQVDLMGFHSGCLVALETALQGTAGCGELWLIDIPYFLTDRRAELAAVLGQPAPLPAQLNDLESAWSACVTKRIEQTAPERCYELFVDQVSTGTATNNAFIAAFSYPCEERFAALTSHHVHAIATAGGLHAETLAAAAVLPDATLTELPEITAQVLETGAPRLVETVRMLS